MLFSPHMIRNRGSPNKRATNVKRFTVTLLLVGVLFGCSVAPVQEMSDARQSIEAARDAGAVRLAPANLNDAERHLDEAKRLLDLGQYDQARQKALTARELALEARRKAIESSR